MLHLINEVKNIMQMFFVYMGSAITMLFAWLPGNTVTGIKDGIAILVGIATLVYTIFKIKEIRRKLKNQSRNEVKP